MRKILDSQNLARWADWFALGVAVVLPWSTSCTAVFVVLWLISLLASWNIAERFRNPWLAAGYLPALLWVVAAFGTLSASMPWAERFASLGAFHKLLAIAFFAIQFRDSPRGMWVLLAFLISCSVLLIISCGLILGPELPWRGRQRFAGDQIMIGVPVKDYNSQTTMFTLCIIGLVQGALQFWHKGKRLCAVLCVLLVTSFFVNILYATTSRTALVALPLLFALFAFRRLSWSSAGALLIAMIMSFAAVWPTSSSLARVADFLEEVRTYEPTGVPTSAGERLEFWRKSIDIVAAAPFFGHGTGSIHQQFRQSAAGQTGMAGLVTADPHNQIFATAIQLGLVGTVRAVGDVDCTLFFFSTANLAAGIGLSVVVQNMISSLFNSSLFDSTHGWLYVLGVGVIGGMTLRQLGTHPIKRRPPAGCF